MKILLDHNLPRRLGVQLPEHRVTTTRQMRWEMLRNGELIAAAAAQFDAFITIDKKIEHEQNLSALPLPIIALDAPSNAMPDLILVVPFLKQLLEAPLEKAFYLIQTNGIILKLTEPR